jgi:hypothetical protein
VVAVGVGVVEVSDGDCEDQLVTALTASNSHEFDIPNQLLTQRYGTP